VEWALGAGGAAGAGAGDCAHAPTDISAIDIKIPLVRLNMFASPLLLSPDLDAAAGINNAEQGSAAIDAAGRQH